VGKGISFLGTGRKLEQKTEKKIIAGGLVMGGSRGWNEKKIKDNLGGVGPGELPLKEKKGSR